MDEMLVEHLAELVHKAYCREYELQNDEEYWTSGNYDLLDEDTKEFDRESVRAVVDALQSMTITNYKIVYSSSSYEPGELNNNDQ